MPVKPSTELARIARSEQRARAKARDERARLRAAIVKAHAAGVPKMEIHQITRVSRPTIDAWIDQG